MEEEDASGEISLAFYNYLKKVANSKLKKALTVS
jgi:hypothetical protein